MMPDAGVLEMLRFLTPTAVIQVDRPAITLTLYTTCTPFSFHMKEKGNDKRKQQNNKPNKQNESRQPH